MVTTFYQTGPNGLFIFYQVFNLILQSADTFSGKVFLFCGGKQDRFKPLYWDGQGYWLLYKRFENGKMNWPKNQDEVKALTSEQVDWLMKGFSITPNINNAKARNFY